MTDVKICGLTRIEDVEEACALGAAYVGFNFSSASPRRITPEIGRRLAGACRGGVRRVGVFVDETYEEIREAIDAVSLDIVQLHRTLRSDDLERVSRRVLAVAHAGRDEEIPPAALLEHCAGILFDTAAPRHGPGGTGVPFDWFLLEGRTWPVPLFVSGGLSPENVGESIRRTRPTAVDVASGVEILPGVKDRSRMRAFFEAVRAADPSS